MSQQHSGTGLQRASSDSLPGSLGLESDKPDFKQLDLGASAKPRHSSATGTSSSSSSSDSLAGRQGKPGRRSDGHSGEILASSATSGSHLDCAGSVGGGVKSRPGHRRSMSAGVPLYFSGRGFGNIGGAAGSGSGGGGGPGPTLSAANSNAAPKPAVLGSGTANYGHGSIMRGAARMSSPATCADGNVSGGEMRIVAESVWKKAAASCDPEEVKKGGNEMYRRGNFVDALALYDRAIAISPGVAAYRSNRAAALMALGRLGEAVKECLEAVRLDSGYWRAHQRLASLYLRLGLVENARYHIGFPGQLPDPNELQKLYSIEKHLSRCEDARKTGDWKNALKESDAAIAAGAEYSLQLNVCKAEALLKLQQLENAQSIISDVQKYEVHSPLGPHIKFYGILAEAYVLYVKAQIEMAFGRFDAALSLAEKASRIDYSNAELETFVNKLMLVASARSRGNDLFNSGKFAEACTAYGEGLKHDQSNSVLYCNRAICWSKLGLWEQSVEDCNQALKIQPTYTKALLRRAASYIKLERWTEAVKDYETLRKEHPDDNEVAEALFNAQAAVKKHQRDLATVSNVKFGEVHKVANLQQLKAATSSPSLSVVLFTETSSQQCEQISTFVNTLCVRYPFVHFLKVCN
uniref:Uncharacterized protein n=1 Tax=Kalanchoe fedtschenkoi TaxID=63787 RepID=A0A7N0VCQ2_KALFE